jgi:ribosomal protein S18 acetylase RimI-like enzyme
MMDSPTIEYRHNFPLDPHDVVRVFISSKMPRPTDDLPRITRMFATANLVLSAWDQGRLIGVCRALTDYSYCCYVSELAVDCDYQRQGIGRTFIERLREMLGDEVSLILLSVPEAMDYYRKLGFEPAENGFVLRRKR